MARVMVRSAVVTIYTLVAALDAGTPVPLSPTGPKCIHLSQYYYCSFKESIGYRMLTSGLGNSCTATHPAI